ncbi:MarR family transcriptional regulator [Phaeodactylibacter luteus]|uniref:MarR family transcriptional regulator n=2 Tax=Phaeodactylibacter luteus TaxID=1564516 RepID=A0A5C6RJE9_9BACT|nr:MarR family transcriptional regulator [Phaeodactylibacter luteus]
MPGFTLERTAKRMKQFFQQTLAAAGTGITIDQWVVLQVLNQQNGLSQLEIARATYKDAPTITRIIDLLCKKGFTERVTDANDRRKFRIELTAGGRQKIDEVLPIIQHARRKAWDGLGNQQIDQLMDTLNQLFDNLAPEEG